MSNLKPDIKAFIIWSLRPENKVFVKKSSYKRIADTFNEESGYHICHTAIPHHRNRWILINGEPFEIARLPSFILNNDKFKDFAKANNIVIETMEIEQSKITQKDIDVETIND